MKIDDLTVTVKVNDEAFTKAVNKLNEKIQEIKNIKNEMCIILNDLDKMLDGKLLFAKTEVDKNFENRIKDEGQTQLHECECINIPENKVDEDIED
jgi:hypothetical protein